MQARLNELCQILGEGSIHRTESEVLLLSTCSNGNYESGGSLTE